MIYKAFISSPKVYVNLFEQNKLVSTVVILNKFALSYVMWQSQNV